MPICIYCLEEKPDEGFNTEHVVPQAFGLFKDSLILQNTVCVNCNSYFGENLDRWLSRESAEGLERYRWRVRPLRKLHQFDRSNVDITASDLGKYSGLILEPGSMQVGGEMAWTPAPQIGFHCRKGGWKWFAAEDVEKGEFLKDEEIVVEDRIKLLPASEADRLLGVLGGHGIKKSKEGDFNVLSDREGFDVIHRFAVTDDIRRSLAKIAFNYFAKIAGPSAALTSAFDPIRKYVLWGRQPFLRIVRSNVPRVFKHPLQAEGKDPIVHYMAIHPDRRSAVLVCQVSLMGWIAHDVVLCFTIPNGLEDLRSGHMFNLADWQTYDLMAMAPEDVLEKYPWASDTLDI